MNFISMLMEGLRSMHVYECMNAVMHVYECMNAVMHVYECIVESIMHMAKSCGKVAVSIFVRKIATFGTTTATLCT